MGAGSILLLLSVALLGIKLASTGSEGVGGHFNGHDQDDQADGRGWGIFNSTRKPLFCKWKSIQRLCCGVQAPGPGLPPAQPPPQPPPQPAPPQPPPIAGRRKRSSSGDGMRFGPGYCSDRVKKMCCQTNYVGGRLCGDDDGGNDDNANTQLVSRKIDPKIMMIAMRCALDLVQYVLEGKFEFPKVCCEIPPFGFLCKSTPN